MVIQHADLGRSDARILQLHGRPLLAPQHDDGGSLDGYGAGAAFDGFEGIFDLEDVSVGGEDCSNILAPHVWQRGNE